jgi:lipoyl-dependent peroxiredoxin
MLRDDQQLARACRALLATVRLERLWTDDGPTPEASGLIEADAGRLSSCQRTVLLAAWTFWNGSGGLRLAEVLDQFDADPMEALCFLVMAAKCGDERRGRALGWRAPSSPTSRCLHRQQLDSPGADQGERQMKPLYTTAAVAHGGRHSRLRSIEPPLDLPYAAPRSLGGPGGNVTNPEQLLAAGYAACFESALRLVARMQKRALDEVEVTAQVTLGQDDAGAFRIAVALHGRIPGVGREDLQALMEAAHKICPYSNATRGNVEVALVAES